MFGGQNQSQRNCKVCNNHDSSLDVILFVGFTDKILAILVKMVAEMYEENQIDLFLQNSIK
jgi:hypothetical protein